MNKNTKWDPSIDYAAIAARKRLKFKFAAIIAICIISIGFLISTYKAYGDACYKMGNEMGIRQGYRLRLAEEALKQYQESDSLQKLSQDIPKPMAL